MNSQDRENDTVRIDKWLWAARFFKTRALAKASVESGKVRYDGARVKSSKAVHRGARLDVLQGNVTKTVIVDVVSARRGPASVAQTLYTETDESIALRDILAQQRAVQRRAEPDYGQRPDKRSRKLRTQLKQDLSNE